MDRFSGALIRLLITVVLLSGSTRLYAAGPEDNTPPSAPGNLVATPVSASQINLSWTAATDAHPIALYNISRCVDGSCTDLGDVGGNVLSYSDTGLSSGVTYTYYVSAMDTWVNTGPDASASATTLDNSPPSAPPNLMASPASASQINLSWSSAGDNVGVAGYLVEMCAGSGCSSFSQIGGTAAISYNVTGLSGATSYSFRVRAYDAVPNYGDYSATATAMTTDTSPPGQPASLTASPASGTQINLTWPTVTDNIGVSGYRIESCSGAACTGFSQIGTSGSNSYNATGLTPATTYRFQVRAYDTAGNNGLYSPIASATTRDSIAPQAPTGLTATPFSGTRIDLSWPASTDNVAVTGYAIERCTGAGCTNFSQVATSATNSYSNTGLTSSTLYRYQVRAYDAFPNYSSPSPIAFATTSDGSAPSTPGSPMASVVSSSQINLTWTASTDNVAVTGYLVERCAGAACTNFVQVGTTGGNTLIFGDTGLTAATTYRYQVRARDAIPNYSTYSSIVSATTLTSNPTDTQAPTAPTNLTVTPGTNQLSLSWTGSTDNVGVTAYLVERCAGAGCSYVEVGSVTASPYLDTNVSVATSYSYRVRARDAANNRSGYSNVGTAMPADCD